VQYVHGYHEYLARLYHRAERLWQRLESVNAQLFRHLREQLITEPDTRATLYRLRETYVGHGEHKLTWEDLDADYLDIFINGVLGIASPPEETKPLEPGDRLSAHTRAGYLRPRGARTPQCTRCVL
jgi:hypothetical protein